MLMKSTHLIVTCLLCLAGPAFGMTNIAGNLLSEAQRLEGFCNTIYGQDSSNYVAPTFNQWTNFRAAATALWNGDVAAAEAAAAPLGYELVRFTHTNTGVVLYSLRSTETNGAPQFGWGTFFVNTNATLLRMIEAPHPQWDLRTPQIAADAFLQAQARGLIIAGAHRHCNGTGTADPCDLTNTLFHAAHVAWNGASGTNTGWQIHGFSISNHLDMPTNTMAVLSTGRGGTNRMSFDIRALNQQLEMVSIKAYAYNSNLPASDPLNLEVNEGLDGQTFIDLGARSNVQGLYSRGIGGVFVHCELVTFVRTNSAARAAAATAIAKAVQASLPVSPFRVDLARGQANQLILSWPTQPIHTNFLEQKATLSDNGWQPVTNFLGNGLPQALTNALTNSRGFFRVYTQ